MTNPEYVESPGGRLYEVVVVSGYPTKNRRRFRCLIDSDSQRIEVSDKVAAEERSEVIARALSGVFGGSTWCLVPVVGRVR